MANKYYDQAAAEIDSYIGSGKAVNKAARDQTIAEYALYLKQLDATRGEAVGSMDGEQEIERARMANRLASRGNGAGGGMQFNYGRLAASHGRDRAKLYSEYMMKRGDLLGAQGKAVGTIDAQDAALEGQRLLSSNELARKLEDRARAYEMQNAQMRSMGGRGRGGGRGGDPSDELDDINDAMLDLYLQGASPEQMAALAGRYGMTLDDFPFIGMQSAGASGTRLGSRLPTKLPIPQKGGLRNAYLNTLTDPIGSARRSQRYNNIKPTLPNGAKYGQTMGSGYANAFSMVGGLPMVFR